MTRGTLGLLLLAAVGCGEHPTRSAPATAAVTPEPEVVLVRKPKPDEAGNAAAGGGVLTLRDGCLFMAHPDGSRTLLLWPAEARLERSPGGELRVLGTAGKAQHTVRVGEHVLVGGSELGGGDRDSARVGPGREMAATAAFPAGCTGRVWNIYSFEPGRLP